MANETPDQYAERLQAREEDVQPHICTKCRHCLRDSTPKLNQCGVSISNENDKYTYEDWEPEYAYCSTVRQGQGITCEWYGEEE